MIDIIVYWLGAAIAVAVLVGALALAAAWAIEKVLSTFNLTKEIVAWYVDKARKDRVRG